jgi:hypothetical protein
VLGVDVLYKYFAVLLSSPPVATHGYRASINIATTSIQLLETKRMLGQQQKHAQEKINDSKGEVTK